ncbi:MAG TPA: dihydroxyacetone kinase family protein, partial [Ruania sp.]|nr:dihydroxyacetone kinase family protein [Ruania sp.]
FGNYAGDVLHFGLAAQKLQAEGIDVRTVKVSDDVASDSPENHRNRRGIAGDMPVFKIAGAAIQAGADIDEAERIAWKANDAARSLGVAFDGCTVPGADDALFHVPQGKMAIGLGIHGEPGIDERPMPSAEELAHVLVEGVLKETPALDSTRAAVILNGLGRVKYEEMFLLYRHVSRLLAESGIEAVRPEVDEHVTSLDMAGVSLTVVRLDEELEKWWLAPADTPAFRRGGTVAGDLGQERTGELYAPGQDPIPEAAEESQQAAARIVQILQEIQGLLLQKEDELGKLDAVAGDGDHGQAMVLGARGAAQAAARAAGRGAGARTVLVQAGSAWSAEAGGTSGALWGCALTAAGCALDDGAAVADADIVTALLDAVEAMERLGGAAVGDKTMMDAAAPLRQRLAKQPQGPAADVVTAAAAEAREAAEETADLTARLGRARVLGEKSKGTPDPGAVSFGMVLSRLAELLSE